MTPLTEIQSRTLTERVGERLRGCREKARLSLDEAAARTGMSKAGLWQIETARSSVHLAFAFRLARLYGVSLDWLVAEDAPTQPIPKVTSS